MEYRACLVESWEELFSPEDNFRRLILIICALWLDDRQLLDSSFSSCVLVLHTQTTLGELDWARRGARHGIPFFTFVFLFCFLSPVERDRQATKREGIELLYAPCTSTMIGVLRTLHASSWEPVSANIYTLLLNHIDHLCKPDQDLSIYRSDKHVVHDQLVEQLHAVCNLM